jgi:hypothetical protein
MSRSELVSELVEPAQVSALKQLGEGDRALGIANGWLRGRSNRVDAALEENPVLSEPSVRRTTGATPG